MATLLMCRAQPSRAVPMLISLLDRSARMTPPMSRWLLEAAAGGMALWPILTLPAPEVMWASAPVPSATL